MNVSAEVECASNHAPYTWAFKVKQANDFNGTPGNDLAQDAAVVNTVTGTCGIVFAAQPRHAEKAPVAITNAIYNPAGPPVSVSVRSGDGLQTVGWWSGTITLAIGDIPAGASPTLGGTTTGPAINGVVTFAPTINASATGYSLVAAASATAGTPSVGTTTNGLESNSFNIVDDAMICTASAEGCEALAGVGQRTQARVRAIGNGAAGDLVILSLNDPAESIECAGYTESSTDVVVFSVTRGDGVTPAPDRSKLTTITVAAAFVTQTASKYQVCYQDDIAPLGPGLLATCANRNPAPPCILSKALDRAKNLVIVISSPAGDPKLRL